MNEIIIREMNETDRKYYGVKIAPTKEDIQKMIKAIHNQFLNKKEKAQKIVESIHIQSILSKIESETHEEKRE